LLLRFYKIKASEPWVRLKRADFSCSGARPVSSFKA